MMGWFLYVQIEETGARTKDDWGIMIIPVDGGWLAR